MVTYDPKEWFKLIFRFHKSDTFRRLFPTMVLLGLLTAAAVFLEDRFLNLRIPSLTVFHQIAGFVISLVLVFRINTAYDRWWEGRKLWGSLVNNARNLAMRLDTIIPLDDLATRRLAAGLITSFPYSLKDHLRSRNEVTEIVFSEEIVPAEYEAALHRPNYIARQLGGFTVRLSQRYQASPNDLLILSENTGALTDIGGACERIHHTPIPYSYSIFIKKIIFLYIITMPVGFGLAFGYWSVLVVMVMFYAFASLELISEEIEDPFGTDANDLPTDELSRKIRLNVNEILRV